MIQKRVCSITIHIFYGTKFICIVTGNYLHCDQLSTIYVLSLKSYKIVWSKAVKDSQPYRIRYFQGLGGNGEGLLGHGRHSTERICSSLYTCFQFLDFFFFTFFRKGGLGCLVLKQLFFKWGWGRLGTHKVHKDHIKSFSVFSTISAATFHFRVLSSFNLR